ncbi:MAG TPA: TerC family protein [Candidatus Limnocylindria bacterium]|nr:TerC family protein [Candidatus Limnocylindria bacterium]
MASNWSDMFGTPAHMWLAFGIVVAVALVVDLGIFHHKSHKITLRLALAESASWIGLALAFNLWVYYTRGTQAGLEFLTGYLVEKSLSVDNIFIFILIFQAFRVPGRSHHKVLYCGVVGALVLRAGFVLVGVGLLQAFHAVLFLFGAILLFTGFRMMLPGERVIRPERNWLVRLARRFIPVLTEYEGDHFLVKRDGKWNATPLFLALVAVEAMDIIFAIDSVPAVLAITRDTFIVYSSNVFAILGLRALYFALANILPRFRFLHQGLAVILIFVGAKMLLSDWWAISTSLSLGIIAGVLVTMVLASVAFSRESGEKSRTERNR